MNIWGPFCWLVEPPTDEEVERMVAHRARVLGFADSDALDEAESAGNHASEGDDMARLALRYIEKDRSRVLQSRGAASVPRKSKWDHLRQDALDTADQIRANRSDLTDSSVADLVLGKLDRAHEELPDVRTIKRWIKKTGH